MTSSTSPSAMRRRGRAGSPIPRAARALVTVLTLVVMAARLLRPIAPGSCPRQHHADGLRAGHAALAAAQLPHGDHAGDAVADVVPCGTSLALPAMAMIATVAAPARQARPDTAARFVASHDPPPLFRPPRVS